MITDDPNHPGIDQVRADGQNEAYLVLSDAERARGFVRPVRRSYVHAGIRPANATRDLTDEENARHAGAGYVKYEPYPPGGAVVGRYWTAEQLRSGCGVLTTMGEAIAETYARDPTFYGSTYCVGCGKHLRVEEFVWDGTSARVGS